MMLAATTRRGLARLGAATSSGGGPPSSACVVRQLLLAATCGCTTSPAAAPQQPRGSVAARGTQSAAGRGTEVQQQQQQAASSTRPEQQQQQQQQQAAAADSSVLDTMKLLEAGIGPLSTQPMAPPPAARVFVISGPSGVGKDAVLKRLQQQRPDLHFVVTATSRPMRPGEVEGIDYLFVSKAQFEAWIASDQLLEHALVYGEYKGIPRDQVDAALQRGCDVILRIDVQGAATVRRLLRGVVSVFLVAESEAQLVARLVARKTEPLDKMVTRVQTARQECQQLGEFDYVVPNREGQLEDCVAKLCAIIDAERHRSQGSSSGGSGDGSREATAAGGAAVGSS